MNFSNLHIDREEKSMTDNLKKELETYFYNKGSENKIYEVDERAEEN